MTSVSQVRDVVQLRLSERGVYGLSQRLNRNPDDRRSLRRLERMMRSPRARVRRSALWVLSELVVLPEFSLEYIEDRVLRGDDGERWMAGLAIEAQPGSFDDSVLTVVATRNAESGAVHRLDDLRPFSEVEARLLARKGDGLPAGPAVTTVLAGTTEMSQWASPVAAADLRDASPQVAVADLRGIDEALSALASVREELWRAWLAGLSTGEGKREE